MAEKSNKSDEKMAKANRAHIGIFMAIILFTAFLILSNAVSAEDIAIKTYVNDYANILSPEEEQQITGIAKSIYDSGQAQYAVVAVNSLGGQDIETYSINLAQGKLGSAEKNNGLLLLIAVEDHKYRFEVGKGLEGTLNDAKVGRIGRYYIVPYFKKEQYGQGVIEASKVLQGILVNGTEPQVIQKSGSSNFVFYAIVIIIIYIIMLVIPFLIARQRKKEKYYGAAMGAMTVFGGSGKGRGGWGGFGGLGGGGSSGGFGGGGFGGGGASGGW